MELECREPFEDLLIEVISSELQCHFFTFRKALNRVICLITILAQESPAAVVAGLGTYFLTASR